MAACSQEAGREHVSGVKIQQLCEGGGGRRKKQEIQLAGKEQQRTTRKGRNVKTYKENFQKVKRLRNLGRCVCASGSRND